MLSFHNDPAIKVKYLARVAAHRAADNLMQKLTWEGGKGCAIGCTLEAYDHSRYPIELGVPMELARLEDQIFEGLADVESQAWPERFLSAIGVGRDLVMVWPKFALWMLRDLETKFATRAPKPAKACGDVAALYDRWIAGDKPAVEEWRKSRQAASSDGAADAADDAAAAYAAAAYAAAVAVAAYAAAAADAVAVAVAAYAVAAGRAARGKFWTDAASKLEELLKAA